MVIAFHSFGKMMDESTPWDGQYEIKKADVNQLKNMCAWYDPDDAENKSSYKLPHHKASDLKLVWNGLKASMSALLGARGGVNIPDSDKKAVYDHLAEHYREFDKTPPEFALRSNIMDKEIRLFKFEIEKKPEDKEDNKKKRFIGYASVFNSLSHDLGGFREIMKPGAFGKTIQEADVRALINHDPNFVLARSKNGSLQLMEDDKGLLVSIEPSDTTYSNDLYENVRSGNIDQMSFGFRVIRDKWTDTADGLLREVSEVQLFDVSIVTFPAYEESTVSVRSIELDKLGKIMLKCEHGVNLNPDEAASVRGTIQILNSFVKESPGETHHSETPNSNQLEVERLKLISKELNQYGECNRTETE